ncbi:MAG TPA: tyrosine-protein phosphatase [Gemmataceae bacterium]|nr:tyrosine-protein phosphatase [Gemmataceae bacterium]
MMPPAPSGREPRRQTGDVSRCLVAMDTPARPTDRPPPRRSFLGTLLRGAVAGVLLAVAGEAGRVLFTDNLHVIEPGQFYRCSQPSPGHLERLIKAHGIRTVVNLRGFCYPFDWYVNESRKTAALDVCQEDLCFSAGRLPSEPELRRLVEVIDHSERPLLFHCQRGADRTGLASAVALLLEPGRPYAEARRQLGLRYGHVALRRPANLDLFFDLYEQWLARNGRTHAPDTFRHWARHEYCPGPCRASIEGLDLPHTVPLGEPIAIRVRCRNLSDRPWRFSPWENAGVHATFSLHDPEGTPLLLDRAGLFDAEVPPGGSIDLTLPLPAQTRPGRYVLTVDMIEEQHCNFFQTGSEPLEWEFEVGK